MSHQPRVDAAELRENVIKVMKTVFDPEIPVNIYDLGMVYDIDVKEDGTVNVKMTLTSPACPVAGTLPYDVQSRIGNIFGVTAANVELVWDPPWNPGMLSESAKLDLGMV